MSAIDLPLMILIILHLERCLPEQWRSTSEPCLGPTITVEKTSNNTSNVSSNRVCCWTCKSFDSLAKFRDATLVKVRQERSAATRWGANVLREAVEKITYPGLDLSRVKPPVKPARALRRQSVGF